jgi:hypothetical protein
MWESVEESGPTKRASTPEVVARLRTLPRQRPTSDRSRFSQAVGHQNKQRARLIGARTSRLLEQLVEYPGWQGGVNGCRSELSPLLTGQEAQCHRRTRGPSAVRKHSDI